MTVQNKDIKGGDFYTKGPNKCTEWKNQTSLLINDNKLQLGFRISPTISKNNDIFAWKLLCLCR